MGHGGITKVQKTSLTGHPGQQSGSARKKEKRFDKKEALQHAAAAKGVTVFELIKINQQLVDQTKMLTDHSLQRFAGRTTRVNPERISGYW